MDSPAALWALALYRRSVIKQAKFERIAAMLPPLNGLRCLDIGGDNGVISLLLRRRGGEWSSADLDETTVDSIREVAGGEVVRIDGQSTPFPAAHFDLVVIIDFLEHIATERAFAAELARIMKPGGILIVNVPHTKTGSLILRLRNAIGLTDEWHGHLRPGYLRADLETVFGDSFRHESSRTYSKFFAESVDTALNWLQERRRGRRAEGRSRKGTVVTRAETEGRGKELRLLSIAYPILWLVVRLDLLLFFRSGHKLIARFVRCHESSGPALARPLQEKQDPSHE